MSVIYGSLTIVQGLISYKIKKKKLFFSSKSEWVGMQPHGFFAVSAENPRPPRETENLHSDSFRFALSENTQFQMRKILAIQICYISRLAIWSDADK